MTEPKKGKDWLRLKLQDGANRLWSEPTRTRFDWRTPDARLVDSHTGQAITSTLGATLDSEDIRKQLRSSDAIAALSVRVVARDWKRRGREVETWLRCSLIQRMVVRVKPTREGISHDRYSILIAFLVAHGVAEPDGRNGYQWTGDYKSLAKRAEWLTGLTHRVGELRNPKAAHRYSISLD